MRDASQGLPSRWLPLHAGVTLGLALASLDAAIGMLGAGHHLMHPGLTGLLPLTLTAYLLSWFGICWPLNRWYHLHPTPLALGLAAFFLPPVAVLTLGQFVNVEGVLAASGSAAGIFQLVVLGSIGLGFAFLIYRNVSALARCAHSQRIIGHASHAFAIVLFAFAVSVWLHERAGGTWKLVPVVFAPFLITISSLSWAVRRMRFTKQLLTVVHVAALLSVVIPPWFASAPHAPVAATAKAADYDPGLVLLITVDTLRRDALSIYDEDARPTPAFDAIARDGIIYDNAFASAPWTLPSLASVHSGLPETVHQMTAQRPKLPAGIPTLAEFLRDHGYATAAIGSNPWLGTGDLGRGFESTHFYPKTQHRSVGSKLIGNIAGVDEKIDLRTEQLTDRALKWIEGNGNSRSFLWLHYFDPHSPYEPPAELIDGDDPGFRSFSASHRVMSGSWQTTAFQKERIRQLYEAEVQHVDRNLGRIVADLESRDLYDEALIVILADHGEEFWDHDTAFHGHTLFDEMVRVPLIVKLPSRLQRSGVRVETPVTTASVGSTILELSGVEREPSDEFFSALPLRPLDEAGPGVQPIVISGTEYFERRAAVVHGRHKLIVHRDSQRRELYDLLADPSERCDLAAHEPGLVVELLGLLELHDARAFAARIGLGLETPTDGEMSDAVREQLQALGYLQ